MPRALDLEGVRFGRLVPQYPTAKNTRGWVCLCDCGKEVFVRTNELTQGAQKSCGCRSNSPSWKWYPAITTLLGHGHGTNLSKLL